jgi:hypothetical protein
VFTLFIVPVLYGLIAEQHQAAPAEDAEPFAGGGAGALEPVHA